MNDLSHDHDDGLSPAARAALAALRADDDLPTDARARMWARLAAQEAVPSDMSQAPANERPRWTVVVVGLAIAAGVALALVGPGRGASEIAADSRGDAAVYDDAARAGHTAVRPALPPATTAVVEPAPEPTPVIAAEPRRPRERVAAPEPVLEDSPASAGTAPVPEDSSTLAAETALLQRAQAALASEDPGAALARLGEHAQQFPRGVLARERDALRVTALCAAGRSDEGRAEAAAFLKAHGSSLLAERVRGACEP